MKSTIALAVSVAFIVAGSAARAQSGNAARGERLFNQQCKACHVVDEGARSPVGPNLHGLFGRKAGTAPGFEASPAMAKSGIVWDDKTLAEYLKDPKGRVPDNKMVFAGFKQQAQLDDVIAYLEKATK